ncbi:hypothetical protein [Micromonospora sp. NPDC047074]
MIEATEQLNAVRRQVGRRLLEAGEARMTEESEAWSARPDRPGAAPR